MRANSQGDCAASRPGANQTPCHFRGRQL